MEKLNVEKRMLTVIMVIVIAAMMMIPALAIMTAEPKTSEIEKGKIGANLTLVSSAPTEPRNLVADPGNEFVWLWWDHPLSQGSDLIKNYTIFRGTTPGGEDIGTPIAVVTVGINFYNDTEVTNGTAYYYKLTAQSDAGNSSYSGEVSATPNDSGSPPSGPQNLVATNLRYSAQLNWSVPSSAGSTPVRMFDIYRNPLAPGIPITTTVTSGLWITGYEDNDYSVLPGNDYNYTVRAINSYGAGSTNVSVRVTGTGSIPGAPENLTASGGNNSVTLYWGDPANPSDFGISRYDIYRSPTSGTGFVVIGNSTFNGFGFNYFYDYNVVNGQTYFYKVKTVNVNGGSLDFSNEASATPNLKAPYVLAYQGDNQVLILWGGVANATGYDIYRSTTSNTETLWGNATKLSYFKFDNTTTNGVPYFYKMKAKYGITDGPFSNEVTVTPNPGSPPAAPTNMIATPENSGVDLFIPKNNDTNILIGYEIYRGNTSGSEVLIESVTAYNSLYWSLLLYFGININDGTAVDDVTYYYTVKLLNMFGSSGFSNEATSFASPTGDVPEGDITLSATAGSANVTLSWSNPSYMGTANLLEYTIMRDNGTGWDIEGFLLAPAGTQTWVDTYVIPAETYHYMVIAGNNYGESVKGSNVANASISGSVVVPTKPLNLQADAGNNYVQLSWDPPANNGGSAVTGYTVLRGSSSGSITTVISTTTGAQTYNDTTALNGQTYWYAVKATNVQGTGPASDATSAVPAAPSGPPGKPTGLVATPGNAQVVLGWNAPSSSGGSAITRYDIFRGNSSANISATALGSVNAASALTYTDSSLTNGLEYWYAVKAVNAQGSGLASDSAHAVPSATGTVPSGPISVTAVGGPGYILVSWAAPSDIGSGVSNYLVFRATTSGGQGSTPLANLTGSVLQYNDTSAVAGTPYFYKVRAWNPYGDGAFSAEVNTSAAATGLPSNPTSLTATPDKGKVIITWGAPTSDGGSAITGYQVLRGSSASTLGVIGNTTTSIRSFTDEDVVAGQTYFYSVVAVNANGNSVQPTPVSAVPQSSDGGSGSDNTWLYVGVGVAAVAIIGGAAYFLMRRKK